MPPTPPPADWWIFFPFEPLIIADVSVSPQMLFGDATVVSPATLEHIFQRPFSSPWKRADAYLAIRRRGVVNVQWFSDDRKTLQFMATVERRRNEIAALLSIAFLATSTSGYLSGLPEQFVAGTTHVILAEHQGSNGLRVDTYGHALDTFPPVDAVHTFSTQMLEQFLHQPLLDGLTRALSTTRSSLATSLRQSIVQASVRLGHAFHTRSYPEQLLGAVTCLEILLSDDQQTTSFIQKEQRLRTLLGDALLTQYDYKAIIHARHQYVHAGEDITSHILPLQAFGLALAALLVYAHLAQQHPTKTALLLYLDTIRQTRQLTALNPAIPPSALGDDLDAFRSAHPLPFFRYVDGCRTYEDEFAAGMHDREDRVYYDTDGDDRPLFIDDDDLVG